LFSFVPRVSIPLAALSIIVGLSAAVQAAPINMTEVRANSSFRSYTMDPTTGKYYEKSNYWTVTSLTEYANKADFEAGISSGSIALNPSINGPYVTINNGNLYARTTGAPNTAAVWNLGTGTTTAGPQQIGTIAGGNSFDWGGGSNGNFLQDETGVYFLGNSTSGSSNLWELHKVDANLNSTSSQTFDVTGITGSAADTSPGFAMMMGGKLLIGKTYSQDIIAGILDFATGDLTISNLEVDGSWGGSSYWNSTFYDSNDDVLYMNNTNTQRLYKVENAKAAFGITAVPEPGVLAIFGLGLAGIGYARRKRTV
jgi:hypothetical protein